MRERARGSEPPRIDHMEMIEIVKLFPGVRANDGVSLDVKSGEVHAILGENGAGKSTLMRQLYGMYQPDQGQIRINGKEVRFRSPADAIAAGIGMIHQHFMLVPTMTVAQNVALGRPSTRGLRLDLDVVSRRIRRLSKEYGLKVDPDAYVWQLSVGEQQRVEIVKALDLGASLIILDEPTAVLTPQEVSDLFLTLRRMVQEGHSLLFISHKLHEVLQVSDRVTVLRDGVTVGTRFTREVTREELVKLMVGRELKSYDLRGSCGGSVGLEVSGLRVEGDRGEEIVRGVDLHVCSGEILGVAGVSGNGQRELAEALSGMRKVTAGEIRVHGREMTGTSLNERVRAGLSFIPEERMRDGAIGEFSVQENVFLRDHEAKRFRRWIFLRFAEMERHARTLVSDYAVKTPNLTTPLKHLSGGNIQKLILARELARRPAVLIASQPTRGVDIGASEYIHRMLLAQREAGTAILLISEDLDEIQTLSDRIAVIYEGRIVGVVDREEAEVERIGSLMIGSQ
ncbi:MAG: ABC transporter ATP-binding protein [Spirochaetaceae bacterium]